MNTDTKSRVLMVGGVSLLLFSVLVAIGWFYFIGPFRRVHHVYWIQRHSNQLAWDAAQKSIKRFGWTHDDFWIVGLWGDERWVRWIIERFKPGDDITSCAAGHKDSALAGMTNQDIGESAESWLLWWKKNKHKNQEQWIAEGFQKMGLKLHSPLRKADVIGLLRLLGAEQAQEGSRMNAFRWLRDSDFELDSFSYSDIPFDRPNEVLNGLKRYCNLIALYPKDSSPHTLALGRRVFQDMDGKPGVCSAKTGVAAWCLIGLSFIGGVSCLYWAKVSVHRDPSVLGRNQ